MGQGSFQLADMRVPLGLNTLDGADALFEGGEAAALLHKLHRIASMPRTFKDEVGEAPPVQVVKVDVASHAWAAAVRHDGLEGNDTAVAEVLGEIRAGGQFVDPPDGIRVGINRAERESVGIEAAGRKVFG